MSEGVMRREQWRLALIARCERTSPHAGTTPNGTRALILPASEYRDIHDFLPPGARWCETAFMDMEHLALPALGLLIVEAWD